MKSERVSDAIKTARLMFCERLRSMKLPRKSAAAAVSSRATERSRLMKALSRAKVTKVVIPMIKKALSRMSRRTSRCSFVSNPEVNS